LLVIENACITPATIPQGHTKIALTSLVQQCESHMIPHKCASASVMMHHE